MGGGGSKEEENNNVAEVEESNGFHLFELHLPTAAFGFGMNFFFTIIFAFILWAVYRKCRRRRSRHRQNHVHECQFCRQLPPPPPAPMAPHMQTPLALPYSGTPPQIIYVNERAPHVSGLPRFQEVPDERADAFTIRQPPRPTGARPKTPNDQNIRIPNKWSAVFDEV